MAEHTTEIKSYFNPKLVIYVCGENDLGDLGNLSVEETFNNFRKVVEALGVPMVYIGTKPEESTKKYHSKYKQYDASIYAWVRERASGDAPPIAIMEVWDKLLAKPEDQTVDPKLFMSDKLHMVEAGYKIWDTELQKKCDVAEGTLTLPVEMLEAPISMKM